MKGIDMPSMKARCENCSLHVDDIGRFMLPHCLPNTHDTPFWDISSINAQDRVVLKFCHHKITVEIIGMNETNATMVPRFAMHNKQGSVMTKPRH